MTYLKCAPSCSGQHTPIHVRFNKNTAQVVVLLKTHPYQRAPSVAFPTLTPHAPSFWFAWLSFPGRPAAASPVRPAYRTPAPSYACGSVLREATGAPGPSGSRAASGRVGAPAETARWRRNTGPASVDIGSGHVFKCAPNRETSTQMAQGASVNQNRKWGKHDRWCFHDVVQI